VTAQKTVQTIMVFPKVGDTRTSMLSLVHSTNEHGIWIASDRAPISQIISLEKQRNLPKCKSQPGSFNLPNALTPSTVDNKLSSSAEEAKTSFSAISASLKALRPATEATFFKAADVSSFL
jgi:hypothetical protein